MRRISIVPVLLAATCLTASLAFAAMDTRTATFESFASSGISGEAVLKALPTGETSIHASIQGLEPGVEYVVQLFPDNQTCASGTVSQLVIRIDPNPSGIVTFNEKVSNQLAQIGSLSIQRASDLTLVACAAVTQQ